MSTYPYRHLIVTAQSGKIRLAEDGWNSRNPTRVTFSLRGDVGGPVRLAADIEAFLTRVGKGIDYPVDQELWAFSRHQLPYDLL